MKDTVVSGSLRATDSLLSTTAQFKILNIPTTNGGTTYGPGTDGYVVSTNGTSVYWRGVVNNTSTGALGWDGANTDAANLYLLTRNTIAYWNGAYKGTSSNLAYCTKGAFGNAVTYGVDDATANGALGTGTGLTTERSVYYGLVTVNNASQTRATGIYAPTSAGTANQILVSSGGTSAPTWKATAKGAAYATAANGALTFGTLGIGYGGTGITSTDPHKVLIGPSTDSSAAPTWRTILYSDLFPTVSKTYAAYTCSANDQPKGVLFFGKITINNTTTWQAPWSIHYKVRVSTTNANMQGWYDCYFSTQGSTVTYYNYNNFYSTSYRPIYHHRMLYPKNNYKAQGAYFGVRVQSAQEATTTARTFTVEVLETHGCSVTLFDTIQRWDQVYVAQTISGSSVAADTIWYSGEWNGTDLGLQEYGDANTNDTGTLIRDYGGNVPIVTTTAALYRYKLLFSIVDTNCGWKAVPANTTNATDLSQTAQNTGKTTIYTGEFNPFGNIYFYSHTDTVNANATIRADRLWKAYPIDLRFSFNCSNTLTAGKEVYLVAYLTDVCKAKFRNPGATANNAAATATGANAGPITQTLPTTNDGYIYIKLGRAYSTYQIDISLDHPVYWHDGHQIQVLNSSIVQKVGAKNFYTFTGNVRILGDNNNNNTSLTLCNEDQTLEMVCHVDANGCHGLYSKGYYDGTNFTSDEKWIIYRNNVDGTIIVNGNCTGSSGSCTGNSATATALYTATPSDSSSDGNTTRIANAVKTWFNDNKDTVPRGKTLGLYLSLGGAAEAIGYYISGYNSSPYGGFFVAYYGTPYYLGISSGSYSCQELVKADNGSYSISVTGSSGSCTGNAANVTGTVAIAHGGTSATTSAGARANLGVPAIDLGGTYPALQSINSSGTATNGWLRFGTNGNDYGWLPAASGGAGSGHNYIGTDAWYWKYAYIDNIYGALLGTLGGAVKVVYRDDFATANAGTGYKRVAKLTGNRSGTNYIVILQSTYNSPHDESVILAISSGYNEANITQLSNSGSLAQWSKVRCLRVGTGGTSDHWLEFYHNNTSYNNSPICVIMNFDGTEITTYKFTASDNSGTVDCELTLQSKGVAAEKVYGAVWNDYVEYRTADTIQPGYVLHECSDGIMRCSTKRLEAGCKISSDTFGFAIGKTDTANTPIAVSGRVLVYPYKNKYEYPLGAAVCSAPGGTVDIMTREEIKEYPERIIGIVSEIPTYDTWQGGAGGTDALIQVNGRIWIYVR